MSSFRFSMCLGLAVCLLAAGPAEARFGKRSDSDDSRGDSQASSDKKTHEATAVGTSDDDKPRSQSSDSDDSWNASSDDGGGCCDGSSSGLAEALLGGLFRAMFEVAIYAIATNGSHLDPGPVLRPGERSTDERRHAAPLAVRLGGYGMAMRDGATASDFYLGIEGRHPGIDARVLRLWLPSDSGGADDDVLTMVEAHVTWTLYAVEHARLRVGAGVSTAHAPDATFIGPSLGASFEACVLGPLDVELRTQVTPYPYRQVDGMAGLALHLGGFVLSGGWRGLYLDDAGTLDGVVHRDSAQGPYFGLGFGF